jgi:hypothetical protein
MILDNTVAIKESLIDVAGKVDAQTTISDGIKNDVGDMKEVANETKDMVKQTIEAVDKLNVLQYELDRAKETIVDKTLKCDRQEQKTAKATQRANECEKNMNTAQNMARVDREMRRAEEAKCATAEQMLALYVELHAASVREYSYRIALGHPVSTEERQIAAYGALLLVKDTIINSHKAMAVEADAKHNAAIATKDANVAAAIAAKDAEIARLTEELAAFRLEGEAMEG